MAAKAQAKGRTPRAAPDPATPDAVAPDATARYVVVHTPLRGSRTTFPVGSTVELTDAEAKRLGDNLQAAPDADTTTPKPEKD